MNGSLFVRDYAGGGQPSFMEEIATLPGANKPKGLTDEQKKMLAGLMMGGDNDYINNSGLLGVFEQGLRGYQMRGK